MSVGERIRKLRWKKGVKLEELGAKVGLTAAAMSRYELGQRRISVELAARIAEALGVPIQALLPTERGGGSGQSGERTISILTALLHYHESVEAAIAGEAPAAGPADEYAEALREAIRCVEEVHKA